MSRKDVRVTLEIVERERKEKTIVHARFDTWQSAENFIGLMRATFIVQSHRIEGPPDQGVAYWKAANSIPPQCPNCDRYREALRDISLKASSAVIEELPK
jgi:hypothetical protein